MDYQGYPDHAASVNYFDDFDVDASLAYPEGLLESDPYLGTTVYDNGFPTHPITGAAQFPPVQQGPPITSGLAFPTAAPLPQQGFHASTTHIEHNSGSFVQSHAGLTMPSVGQSVHESVHHDAFSSRQEPSVVPAHATARVLARNPHPADGDSFTSSRNSSKSPMGRRQVSPNYPPISPVVHEAWKFSHPLEVRKQLQNGRIPRITRPKKTDNSNDGFHPSLFYGEPVSPPEPWGPLDSATRRPLFEYTRYGELIQNRQMDVSQMKMYLYDRRTKNVSLDEWVPRTPLPSERHVEGKLRQGLTLWLGWPAAQSEYRYPKMPGCQTCRFKDCPFPTIKQGLPRVILDERMNDQGLEIDPFFNAGYVHLYCLEKHFDLVELIMDLDFRLDERTFKKEETNLFRLSAKDAKVDLLTAFQNWWKRQYRCYRDAKAQGKRRSRRNYQETSLCFALLDTKLNSESSARNKVREERSGLDVTKYWGDLSLLEDLQQEQKELAKSESRSSKTKHKSQLRARPLVQEATMQTDPVPANTYEHPQYSTGSVPTTGYEQLQHTQYASYSPMVMPPPMPLHQQTVPMHQVGHHSMNMGMVNQQVNHMMPAPTADPMMPAPMADHMMSVPPMAGQWNALPPQQPGMYVPQLIPQPPMPSQGRKRSLEHVQLEDQGLGEFTPTVQEVPTKRARVAGASAYQDQFLPPINAADIVPQQQQQQPQQGMSSNMAGLQDWQPPQEDIAQGETFSFNADDLSGNDLSDFNFDLPPVQEDQTGAYQPQAEIAEDPIPATADGLPNHNDESSNVEGEQYANPVEEQVVAQETPTQAESEWTAEQASGALEGEHRTSLDVDDLFNDNVLSKEEMDAIFGKEDSPIFATPDEEPAREASPASEEPAQEASPADSQGDDEPSEENPEVLEVPTEPAPASPAGYTKTSPRRSPRKASKSSDS